MIAKFDWDECYTITDTQKGDVEAKIRRDVEGPDAEVKFKPCHPGQVTVQLNVGGPFLSDLVGNIKCSCGIPYCKFNGTSVASTFKSIDYERA